VGVGVNERETRPPSIEEFQGLFQSTEELFHLVVEKIGIWSVFGDGLVWGEDVGQGLVVGHQVGMEYAPVLVVDDSMERWWWVSTLGQSITKLAS